MTIGDVIKIEKKEIGYTEGKNNDNKYGRWYGLNNQPWCCIFQEWCFNAGGGGNLIKKTASCGTLWSWAKQKGLLVPTPACGDLEEFTFNGVQHAHIGYVIGTDKTGKYTYTIEGNTSSGSTGSQANGDGVYLRKRPTKQSFCYIRPKYEQKPIKTVMNDREITVWSAPLKLDACRVRTIKPQTIQVYDELIPSFTNEGDYFYRTIKGAFVLAKYCK